MRKTVSQYAYIRKPFFDGYPSMLVGYMRVSSDSDRQSTNLQRDALLVPERRQHHRPGCVPGRAGVWMTEISGVPA
ncbi:hypothetical protein Veis_2860 [Verminephrobacter eiseniae EF01-2]|uniref:Resolvase/invertase-type recombinase catalytic domain-containing protein n=1 Tax=Verminephrobacter eiseniae (strain EF01-2) TaxID=391735 RepID=A1WLT9_VEREI|nr:hypothetical protein Veis_2860 [Verminephrobacter eiseniae EF01-2]